MIAATGSPSCWRRALIALAVAPGAPVFADGPVVDKVYDPYVQPLEREIELRGILQDDEGLAVDGVRVYRLGIGAALSERWFAELYAIGANRRDDNFSLEAYELEAKWQLTEQGQYWADWGLLFELETQRGADAWEYATSALVAKEWGRYVLTGNLGLIYEWGDDVPNEWETELRLQARYRFKRTFEPALEFYAGQDYRGLGPVALGDFRVGQRNRLRWEAGIIFGVDGSSADATWRALIEYEF